MCTNVDRLVKKKQGLNPVLNADGETGTPTMLPPLVPETNAAQ